MAVDTNHEVFSSEAASTCHPAMPAAETTSQHARCFIAMDPPKHDAQRKAVSPVVAPDNLHDMAPLIRERAGEILDALPIGETFDWVDQVSIELTTMTLATLFDFPFEERRKLTYWSDMVTTAPGHGPVDELRAEARRADRVLRLLHEPVERAGQRRRRGNDLISMLAHGEATRDMTPMEYHGNVILLIVGGNDTTRNTISGRSIALNQNPDQYAKLRANPALIPSMVSETIRWQTPLAHMRRTATARLRARRQDHQGGRQGGHVVRLGQPRRDGDRRARTPSSSTASGRASTCRSASASTAASATAWPSCS